MRQRTAWIPEIMYEEDVQGVSQTLPFILVPEDELMPKFILIWEQRDTGEIEPGPNGEEIPIVEADLRQYARMDVLKEGLSADDFDKVRVALGLEPMRSAVKKGQAITNRVLQNVAEKDAQDN